MNENAVFILANQSLKKVVDQIKDDQWGMVMPDSFRLRNKPTEPITLRQIINYHSYDDAWVPLTLSGKTIEEVGEDKYKGDLLGDDPRGNYARFNEAAIEAVQQLHDLDMPVHLSYGDYPAREYLWHIITFRGFRTYELAQVIGADTTMPPDLVQGMWDLLSPHAEEWRQIGVFGPAVEVPDDADLQTKLLAMSGRD